MASILKVDTLTGVTTAGSISVTGEGNSTTTNLQQGLAKAWADYSGSGTTFSDSFNCASATDNGTGDYTITITNDMASGNFSLTGNLTVRGTSSVIATTNLEVKDAFGFFATGSAASNVDAGIIVQSGSFVNSGSAIYHDTTDKRWAVAKSVAATEIAVTALEHVVTVKQAGDDDAPGDGDLEYGAGEMFINDDGTIWIYS